MGNDGNDQRDRGEKRNGQLWKGKIQTTGAMRLFTATSAVSSDHVDSNESFYDGPSVLITIAGVETIRSTIRVN